MRYNLKNFPDVHHFDVESCAKMHRWKEGFERELREKLEKWKPDDWVAVDNPHVSIREVLGE